MMITKALGVVATWFPYRGSIVLVAVLMALWASGTLSGHTVDPATESHLYWVKEVNQPPLVGWYAVTMYSDASTNEYRDGIVMVMNSHSNSITVKEGKCLYKYFFCWGALNTPKTKYSHPGNSYTLTNWSVQTCLGNVNDILKCWESAVQLGWLTVQGLLIVMKEPSPGELNRSQGETRRIDLIS